MDHGWLTDWRKWSSYLAQGFIIGYVTKILLVDKSVPTTAVLIASILGFAIIPFAGWLSDRFGRRIIYRWFCLLLMLYAVPAFMLLDSREPLVVIPTIIVGMGLASLGIFGVQAAWGVELFGVRNRYTKMPLLLRSLVLFCRGEQHRLSPQRYYLGLGIGTNCYLFYGDGMYWSSYHIFCTRNAIP